MNRNVVGPWGAELAAPEFACALAASGVLHSERWTPGERYDQTDVVNRLNVLHQEASSTSLSWFPTFQLSPELLAASWKTFITKKQAALRLEVHAGSENRQMDPLWVLQELSRLEVGADSVYLFAERFSSDRRWHWPLRVGFLSSHSSSELFRQITAQMNAHPVLGRLVSLLTLEGPTDECDLLIIPETPRHALSQILRRPQCRADCVVVAGPISSESSTTLFRLIDHLQAELSANGVGWISSASAVGVASWFLEVLVGISHDEYLDVVFHRSALRTKVSEQPVFGIFKANGMWLEEIRVSKVAATLVKRLSEPVSADSHAQISSDLGARIGLSAGSKSLREISSVLANRVVSYSFLKKSEDATALAELSQVVAPHLRKKPSLPGQRHLQAKVYAQVEGDLISSAVVLPKEDSLKTFKPHALHRVSVRIGPADDPGWITSPAVFPDGKLPPSAKGHYLTVIMTEPLLMPEPRVSRIFLPPIGSSTVCTFFLKTAKDSSQVSARITVLFRNRVLQTSKLEGPVDGISAADRQISWEPEAVVNAGFSDLDRQKKYDAALVLNHTQNGKAQVLKIVDEHAELVSVDKLSHYTDEIEARLSTCDWGSSQFRTLPSKGTLDLLKFLAQHGSLMYRGVVKSQFADQNIASANRIQIIAARPNTRLPVEYFYQFPSPTAKAKLCPSAATALRTGRCSSSCLRTHARVCPLGFWGLSKVIEWHVYRQQARRELNAADFAIQQARVAQRRQLPALKGAVVGASKRADSVKAGGVARVLNALKSRPTIPVESVKTWGALKKQVQGLSPSLLVLIPHTGMSDNRIPQMEIGNSQWLTLDQLDEAYVCGPQTQPIVFLLGCDTALQAVPFEDFISNVSYSGAAIVVAASTGILGREATVLATEFIEKLKRIAGKSDATFGEVMLHVRRDMLRKGFPMVLSISSYGDADWRV